MKKVDLTKEKIIEATVKLAMVNGFANTRTAEIAREAGVSEGLIFKYFPTKKQLFAVIINDNMKRLKGGVEEIINDSKLNPTAKIVALINFHCEFFAVERNIVQLLFGHSDRKSIPDVDPIIQQGLNPYVQLIIKILNEGISAGEFQISDPEVTALAIIGSMQITIINKVFSQNSFDLGQTKNELIKFIVAAIKR